MRTIERIAGESTVAATLEHHTTARVEQATWIENMLYELSKAVKACVQAQWKKIKDFGPTYSILNHKSTSLPCNEE